MKYTWAKAILFIPVWFGSCVIVAIPVFILFPAVFNQQNFIQGIELDVLMMIIHQIVYFAGTLLSFVIMREIIGKRNLEFPSIKQRGLFQGGILAVILILVSFFLILVSGSISISFIKFDIRTIIMGLLLFVFVAINEELLFRGGILQLLVKSYSKYAALLVSSILFAVVHLLNSGITWIGFLNIVLSGAIMGELYLRYKNIVPAISIHLLWNFLQGPILGFAVSGHTIDSVFTISNVSRPMLSGGGFGIEGSVFTLGVQVVCFIILIFNSIKSKLYITSSTDS